MWFKILQEAFESMNEELFFESIEPVKPNKMHVMKGQGDAPPSEQPRRYWDLTIEFITSSNNEVEVIILVGGDSAEISFRVNGMYGDKGRDEDTRDPEILNGVIWSILDFINTHPEINEVSFSAYAGMGDKKSLWVYKKDPKVNKIKDDILIICNWILLHLSQVPKVLEVPATIDGVHFVHSAVLDYDSEYLEYKWENIKEMLIAVFQKHNFDIHHLTDLDNLINRFMLIIHTYKAEAKKKNRRADLYERLLNRYLPEDWEVTRVEKNFFLKKKGQHSNVA